MTTETKLLTEAEWRQFWAVTCGLSSEVVEKLVRVHRARGLIAEEPVDPLLVEAREICAKQAEGNGAHNWAIECRAGECDTSDEVECAMIALRRGMELAPRKLTREMVREAASQNKPAWLSENEMREVADAICTGLTEALQ